MLTFPQSATHGSNDSWIASSIGSWRCSSMRSRSHRPKLAHASRSGILET